jgi:hypothetical protein
MARGGRGSNTFEIWVFFPIFLFFLSLSLLSIPLSFRPREGGKERMTDHVKGCRVHKGVRQL